MTVRGVGGCLIDLTRRDRQSDQLSAFYPGGQLRELKFGGIEVASPEVYEADALDRVFVRARRVTLRLVAPPRAHEPDVEVSYALEDGWPYLLVTTVFANRGQTPIDVDLLDSIRADRSFEMSPEDPADLFWAYDRHFGQAYGVVARWASGHGSECSADAASLPRSQRKSGPSGSHPARLIAFRDGSSPVPISSTCGESPINSRARKSIACRSRCRTRPAHAVVDADVALSRGGKPEAWGRTDPQGQVVLDVGDSPGSLVVSAIGRGSKVGLAHSSGSRVAGDRDARGCRRRRADHERAGGADSLQGAVHRQGRHAEPRLRPRQRRARDQERLLQPRRAVSSRAGARLVRRDRQLRAGARRRLHLGRSCAQGKESVLEAKLVRSVKTDGWISTDFHSHSTPSGDNTSSQLGRVLNLLCEHVEFAPCTEHNRLSTYDPHLKRLGAERLMATCVGIELTGNPLPLNHQNAFPLVLRPNTQDNGGPTADDDPAIQIERLALWDAGSEKLVQVNHPDIGWMFRDRDGNGVPDAGFAAMLGKMDVIEVHPPDGIFGTTTIQYGGKTYNNTIVNWLQLLNQGRRIPGVVNTDAHYNFHGSGWLRNYVKSPTDDPAEIKTLDVVHAAERGNMVMSNGPFLEVKLTLDRRLRRTRRFPGDDLAAVGQDALAQGSRPVPELVRRRSRAGFLERPPGSSHSISPGRRPPTSSPSAQ